GSLWHELGISVVISSHLLQDIERICDRVIIIAHGRLLVHDRIDVLKNQRRRTVEISPSAELDRFASVLTAAGSPVERLSNGRLRLESPSESIEWILELIRANRLPPAEIMANPNVLHELFLASLSENGNQL
ncbi:MAG TPA: hypothetical protein VL069_06440, partial [Opitutus sp.]|nr:hypothetical protein [Opitutus sp.]